MAASARLLSPRVLDCHVRIFNKPAPRSLLPRSPNHILRLSNGTSSAPIRSAALFSSCDGGSWRPGRYRPSGEPLRLSISYSDLSKEHIDRSVQDPRKGFQLGDSVGELAVRECGEGKGAISMVVLLGWLGAEEKHLNRYANIYTACGLRSVRFVVSPWELLRLDLGRKLEAKIARLAEELTEWCLESEKDGRKRHLLFHTFSNTGWLVYGSLLKNMQSRSDVIDRIKGCIVDSGPAPELSPKVWAAGYCAALLKRRTSAANPGDNSEGNVDRPNNNDCKPHALEIIVSFILEKFFNIILLLPDVNERLSTVISILSKNQPPCPQLYLYSSADLVIPASCVESFIQEQRALGKNVHSHNFATSPHVDHFRSFPRIYTAKVSEFVTECCSEIVYRA
ncbi:hypothetical protein KSP40_PGU004196 [Platanthera guangdongensis]|uniref:Transmembrane protein 53 n=1 Tax=Platanthera guangdongensis TaxID=2320717 RepID=A0ABR2N1B3_9ASPA